MLTFEREIWRPSLEMLRDRSLERARERAEWARMTAAEIMKQDMACTNSVAAAHGKAVSP